MHVHVCDTRHLCVARYVVDSPIYHKSFNEEKLCSFLGICKTFSMKMFEYGAF